MHIRAVKKARKEANDEELSATEKKSLSEQEKAYKSLRKQIQEKLIKFATRVLVQSAQDILSRCGVTIDDVDVYVPHQANVRIIEHATSKLGIDPERVVINVDRYGNTSSGSIPLALVDAQRDGRLVPGKLVLMTGMGAGLTWGSSLIEWTEEMAA